MEWFEWTRTLRNIDCSKCICVDEFWNEVFELVGCSGDRKGRAEQQEVKRRMLVRRISMLVVTEGVLNLLVVTEKVLKLRLPLLE